MFPEETLLRIDEIIAAESSRPPRSLISAFRKLMLEHVRCDKDEGFVEALAIREYDAYLEKDENLAMHLFMTREMFEEGHKWQLVLDMKFAMSDYFNPYLEENSIIDTITEAFFHFSRHFALLRGIAAHQAEAIIDDIVNHGDYLSYSVTFGDADN